MIFTGTSGFSLQKRYADQRNKPLREAAEATNQLARMRFNIGIEKNKKLELEKLIEEQEIREAKERRAQEESFMRKAKLCNA